MNLLILFIFIICCSILLIIALRPEITIRKTTFEGQTTTTYYLGFQIHRENGPAKILLPSGEKHYYNNNEHFLTIVNGKKLYHIEGSYIKITAKKSKKFHF